MTMTWREQAVAAFLSAQDGLRRAGVTDVGNQSRTALHAALNVVEGCMTEAVTKAVDVAVDARRAEMEQAIAAAERDRIRQGIRKCPRRRYERDGAYVHIGDLLDLIGDGDT